MSEHPKPAVGTIGWIDLTVDDADGVRDFYRAVAGWATQDVPMGDYSDYCMLPCEGADPIAGVCHARGENSGLPAQWLIYIVVADLDDALARCLKHGGEVLHRRTMGEGGIGVIRDPAGAVCALYQS